jgi:ABC-type Fe3+/spermidine/putrescine transport system ATPase subunit
MIACDRVTLRLGSFTLQNLSFSLKPGECLSIMGPSGAGKTVLLETIAGLHQPDHGRLLIRGADATDIPPEERRIGLVYQDASLFPHMTVAENIGFGLVVRRTPERERIRKVDAQLDSFGIQHLAERHPATLSGGEQQRVALARALAVDPDILLLDEPFAAVDRESRNRLLRDLHTLNRDQGLTMIQVTHALEDALAVADRIAVIFDGHIHHIGPAASVLTSPETERVARFIGIENLIPGIVGSHAGGLCTVALEGGADLICTDRGRPLSLGQRVTACIRAFDVLIGPVGRSEESGWNIFRGDVIERTSAGGIVKLTLDCGDITLAAMVLERRQDSTVSASSGLIASVAPDAIHLIPAEMDAHD